MKINILLFSINTIIKKYCDNNMLTFTFRGNKMSNFVTPLDKMDGILDIKSKELISQLIINNNIDILNYLRNLPDLGNLVQKFINVLFLKFNYELNIDFINNLFNIFDQTLQNNIAIYILDTIISLYDNKEIKPNTYNKNILNVIIYLSNYCDINNTKLLNYMKKYIATEFYKTLEIESKLKVYYILNILNKLSIQNNQNSNINKESVILKNIFNQIDINTITYDKIKMFAKSNNTKINLNKYKKNTSIQKKGYFSKMW
jgi:hypothetical protein